MTEHTVRRSTITALVHELGYDPRDVRSIHIEPHTITVARYLRRPDGGISATTGGPLTSVTTHAITDGPESHAQPTAAPAAPSGHPQAYSGSQAAGSDGPGWDRDYIHAHADHVNPTAADQVLSLLADRDRLAQDLAANEGSEDASLAIARIRATNTVNALTGARAEVERLRALETAARAWRRRYAEDPTTAGRRTTELVAAVDALNQDGDPDATR